MFLKGSVAKKVVWNDVRAVVCWFGGRAPYQYLGNHWDQILSAARQPEQHLHTCH